MAHQRTAHGQHLLLAAGEGAGNLLAAFLQAGELGEYGFNVRRIGLARGESAHFQVFHYRHLQKDAAAFGHLSQAHLHDFVGRSVGDVFAVQADDARAGEQQAGDGAQNGGFTGAVCADQGHDFPVVYLEGDVLNGVNFAVVDVCIVNLQHVSYAPFLPR